MEKLIELEGFEEEPEFNRRLARDIAFKYIFAWQFDETETPDIKSRLDEMSFGKKDRAYIENAVKGVTENIAELDKIISEKTVNWKKERLSKLCLAGIRLGLYEILYDETIPYSVSVNEIVELLKRYDTHESAKYANGILGGFDDKDSENDSRN